MHSKSVTYTDEFVWEDVYHNTEESVEKLIEKIENIIPNDKRKKLTLPRENYDDNDDASIVSAQDDSDVDEEILATPRKKQKTSKAITPRKPRTPSKLLTPSHKRYVIGQLA